jgi:hypothetical protein
LVRKNYSVSCVQPYARTLSDHMECNHCPWSFSRRVD